ncbi:IclR family transcriptional regulator [Arthrobacter pigmenti]
MANSPSGDSMIRRLMRIISSFDHAKPAMSVAVLAKRADIPLATTHRLVNALVDEGVLHRETDGQVRLGLRLWELASRSSEVLSLRQAAMPFMEDVQAVIRQHTQLAVLQDDEVLFVERLSSRDSVVNEAKVAGRLPVHVSSSGMVLLAHSPSQVQEAYLKRNAETVDAGQLRRDLAGVRQSGHAALAGYVVPDTTGIAVPVLGRRQEVVAALGVVVAAGEENIPATVPALMTAARGIARAVAPE